MTKILRLWRSGVTNELYTLEIANQHDHNHATLKLKHKSFRQMLLPQILNSLVFVTANGDITKKHQKLMSLRPRYRSCYRVCISVERMLIKRGKIMKLVGMLSPKD